MGLRTLLRTSTTLVATTVVAALLTTPGASAHVCADCDDPELPDDPGVTCPTIAATADPALLAPTSPTKPVYGQTVTATTGTWNTHTKRLRTQWYVGGQPVGTAKEHSTTATRTETYIVRAADQNKTIRLWVRGIGQLDPCVKDEYSLATAAATLAAPPVNQTAPTLTGTPRVGEVLTADPGTWSPVPASYSYEWHSEAGDLLGHGTQYAVKPGDLGKRIRVEVTAQIPGHFVGFKASALTAATTEGSFGFVDPPSITGKAVFGATLTGADGQWPDGSAVVARQWQRDGKPIAGATQASYALRVADIGHRITYVVTVERPGFHQVTATSRTGIVKPAAAPRWAGKKVALKGKDKVKKKIKVALGVKKIRLRASAPGAKVTYRWLRNGTLVKRSTARAHKVTKADVRKKLRARITITQRGHKPLVITTRAVKVKNSGKKLR